MQVPVEVMKHKYMHSSLSFSLEPVCVLVNAGRKFAEHQTSSMTQAEQGNYTTASESTEGFCFCSVVAGGCVGLVFFYRSANKLCFWPKYDQKPPRPHSPLALVHLWNDPIDVLIFH